MNKTYLNISLFVFLVAVIFTSAGGYLDFLENWTMSKQHFWNDGIFLGIIALGLLILAYKG